MKITCRHCNGSGEDNISIVCPYCGGVGTHDEEEKKVMPRTAYEHMLDGDRENSIAVMGQNGDSVHIWDPEVPTEVDIARGVYTQFAEKGYRAFRMDIAGDQGDQIDEFDPAVKSIIFVPQMQGG